MTSAAPIGRTLGPARDRIPALRAEVAASHAKLARLKDSIAVKTAALNRLLAMDAMHASRAEARRPNE